MKITCSCGTRVTLDHDTCEMPNVYKWGRCVCGRFWGLQRAIRLCDPPKVFIGNGQGCGTVWYYTVADARRAVELNGGVPPHGRQSGLCEGCHCHFSPRTQPKLYRQATPYACSDWKDQWTALKLPSTQMALFPLI